MKAKILFWTVYSLVSFILFVVFCLYGEQIVNFVRYCVNGLWKCWCNFVSFCGVTLPNVVKGWFR